MQVILFKWQNRCKEHTIDLGGGGDDGDVDGDGDGDGDGDNLQMWLHEREWLTTVLVWTQLFKLFAAQKGRLKINVVSWKLPESESGLVKVMELDERAVDILDCPTTNFPLWTYYTDIILHRPFKQMTKLLQSREDETQLQPEQKPARPNSRNETKSAQISNQPASTIPTNWTKKWKTHPTAVHGGNAWIWNKR